MMTITIIIFILYYIILYILYNNYILLYISLTVFKSFIGGIQMKFVKLYRGDRLSYAECFDIY